MVLEMPGVSITFFIFKQELCAANVSCYGLNGLKYKIADLLVKRTLELFVQ